MPDAETPLDEDEASELIPTHLTNQGQLNAWEQANIGLAVDWARTRRDRTTILDMELLRELHRRMFANTWAWAGTFRTTTKNLGVPPELIQERLANLLGDTPHWIEHKTYPVHEIGVRFHHRLVAIHPFPNGNGRHSRLAADMLVESLGEPAFSWGSGDLTNTGNVRAAYLAALRDADQGRYENLIAFARA